MIDFVGKRGWFFFISAIMVIASIACLVIFGLRPGIDFTGGTSLTLEFGSPVEQSQLREEIAKLGHDEATIQMTGENSFIVRLKEISPQERDKLKSDLETSVNSQIKVVDYYSVSPTVGMGTARNAGIGVAIASVAMLFYIVWAFRRMPRPSHWGTCAVLALLHDVLIVVGIFSLLGWALEVEINALFITGLLTVVGYSINNTVVVYDRIRENISKGIRPDFVQTVNCSILETLGRCLNTSLTTLFVVIALFLFGGATIHYFLLVLLLGIIVGTYDSICIAGELLVMWEKGEWGRLSSWLPFVKKPA